MSVNPESTAQMFTTEQQQSDCVTFVWSLPSIPIVSGVLPSSSLCFDGIVGLAATWLGISLIAVGIALVVIASPVGRAGIKTAVVVAK